MESVTVWVVVVAAAGWIVAWAVTGLWWIDHRFAQDMKEAARRGSDGWAASNEQWKNTITVLIESHNEVVEAILEERK